MTLGFQDDSGKNEMAQTADSASDHISRRGDHEAQFSHLQNGNDHPYTEGGCP